MNRKILSGVLSGIGMLLLILDSRQALLSAREAVSLCLRTVVPSLFPFFFLSACMAGSGGGNILFTGFLGGYPVGAQSVAASDLDTQSANRVLTWCSQAGPSFIFGIAAAQFPGLRYGWYLWGVQILSGLCVGAIFSALRRDKADTTGQDLDISAAMGAALRGMGTVCGWVVVFRVILGFLDRWCFFFLPDGVKILLSGLLELTNGCLMLHKIENVELRFLLCLVFLNFGGICVVLQTMSVARRLDIRYYLMGKLVQTVLAVLLGCALMGHLTALIPLSVLFCGIRLAKVRKNSSNPVLIGV